VYRQLLTRSERDWREIGRKLTGLIRLPYHALPIHAHAEAAAAWMNSRDRDGTQRLIDQRERMSKGQWRVQVDGTGVELGRVAIPTLSGAAPPQAERPKSWLLAERSLCSLAYCR